MSRLRFLLLSFVVLFSVLVLSRVAQADWLDDLRLGGYVIVLRHGATYSDDANTDSMSRKNVSPQRQLNDQGRAQAKSIGESMRRLKIPVGAVMTSTTQRAVDTGTLLGFGEVTATPDLTESGPAVSTDENNRRAKALRKLVAGQPPADNNLVIVTHKPNITDAFGKDWFNVREGEASVFEPDGSGGYKLIVRVQANEWGGLVRASRDLPEEQTRELRSLRPFSPHYD
ncbi:MAG TPA: histidine phosphatase family protein [Bradyrhizobium sp.]